jgi:hypothetical protein
VDRNFFGGPQFTTETYGYKLKAEQDAAPVFQKPRTVSENGEFWRSGSKIMKTAVILMAVAAIATSALAQDKTLEDIQAEFTALAIPLASATNLPTYAVETQLAALPSSHSVTCSSSSLCSQTRAA